MKRKQIVGAIFGDGGLSSADSTVVFDNNLRTVHDIVSETAPAFIPYMESRVIPLIKTQIVHPKMLKKI